MVSPSVARNRKEHRDIQYLATAADLSPSPWVMTVPRARPAGTSIRCRRMARASAWSRSESHSGLLAAVVVVSLDRGGCSFRHPNHKEDERGEGRDYRGIDHHQDRNHDSTG
jgi:hypothetical protein